MSFVHLDSQEGTLYDRVGGEHFFTTLVDTFYLGVASDPVLRPLYPEDLTAPSRHLALFLMQYWGGPKTYGDVRGHPRLRMRHVPFAIGTREREAWLNHMLHAVSVSGASDKDQAALRAYFELAATSLLNRPTD